MWGRRSPSKQYRQKQKQTSYKQSAHAAPTRYKNVAANNRQNVLAIYHQSCRRKTQQPARRSKRANAIFYFAWSRFGRYTSKIFSYSLLSNIRVICTLTKCWRCRPSKMGTALVYWSILRTLAVPRQERCTRLESKHRASESTVPRSI